ncbi:MAG: exo-alpha-sialidase [Ardenticatenaceae bacterium]|nr:exo-alpha-sialidase [Ardenticatenaceae bacterium]
MKFETEAIPNTMPFGHAANAVALPGGEIFVTWYNGSYEGGEDQRIAGAVRTANGHWQPTHVVVNRFEYEGDTWIPEIGVPLPAPHGGLRLLFWACPLSTFRLAKNPGSVQLGGGWGGGSWFPIPTITYEGLTWTRTIPDSRVFVSELGPDFVAGRPELFTHERGLVVMGAARRLQSGRWAVPYHTERKDCWFHSRMFVSDPEQKQWETRGDIFAPPGCLEPVIVQLPSREVLCFMRRGGFDGHIFRAMSEDECRTFSEPVQTNLRNPYAGVDLGWSETTECLLVVYNDSYRMRTPLTVGISTDRGKTFRMRDVESTPGFFAYPKLLQDRLGLWHLFYTHNHSHIQHATFDEAWLKDGRQALG